MNDDFINGFEKTANFLGKAVKNTIKNISKGNIVKTDRATQIATHMKKMKDAGVPREKVQAIINKKYKGK